MATNKLYFGDNLKIMREYIADESVDLIYLDPPFNSKATYNVLFDEKNGTHSRAQITAFEDTWHWGIESENAYYEIVKEGPKKIADLIQALRSFLGQNDMMAYLVMMAVRLVEMRRVLKATGSIYLHCDPTASHYLKILMDSTFGNKNFRNEIIWHYRKWPSGNRQFQRNHDCILFYSKTELPERVFNQVDFMERSESTLKRFGESKIISGYDEYGNRLPSQMVKEESLGVPRDDVWDIGRVAPVKQLFPTQKPEKLISRIIRASSNEGDIVMDPFCGCGTAIIVSEELKRKWIGIDITYLAINLIKRRLSDTFNADLSDYEVIGDPKDLQSARALAEYNRFQFEWWALDKVDARPAQDKKKGADSGIDGYIKFFDDNSGIAKEIIIQVKSGHVSVSQIRDLKGVLEREKAPIGAFITLEEPTKPMIEEAVSAGFYEPELLHGKKYPRIQILTINDLLENKQLQYPRILPRATFKNAKRKIDKGKQEELL
jgi:site-specific DNA-methyltransferase (adenine-specific)